MILRLVLDLLLTKSATMDIDAASSSCPTDLQVSEVVTLLVDGRSYC